MWTSGQRFTAIQKGATVRAHGPAHLLTHAWPRSQMLQNISVLLQEDSDMSNAFMDLFPAHAVRESAPEPNGAAGPVLGTLNGGPPVAHTTAAAATAPAAPEPVTKAPLRHPPNGTIPPLPPAPPDA